MPKYVKITEGAKICHMDISSFYIVAKSLDAVLKYDGFLLVNIQKMEDLLCMTI